MKKLFMLLLLLFCFQLKQNAQTSDPYFNSNDRICFIGNSITHAGYYHYFLNLYYATRYPEIHYESYNCGISGDVAGGVLTRMQKDILVHRPTVASMMIGMNDVNRELYKVKDKSNDLEKKKFWSLAGTDQCMGRNGILHRYNQRTQALPEKRNLNK